MRRIDALRLWATRGTSIDSYSHEELEEMEKTGLFYVTNNLLHVTRSYSLTKYADSQFTDVLVRPEVFRSIKLYPDKEIIQLGDEHDKITMEDLLVFVKNLDKIYLTDMQDIIDYISRRFKLGLTGKYRLKPSYMSIVIEEARSDMTYQYELEKDWSLYVRELYAEIMGANFEFRYPYMKRDTAKQLVEEVISLVMPRSATIYGKTVHSAHFENGLRTLRLGLTAYMGGRRIEANLAYDTASGKIVSGTIDFRAPRKLRGTTIDLAVKALVEKRFNTKNKRVSTHSLIDGSNTIMLDIRSPMTPSEVRDVIEFTVSIIGKAVEVGVSGKDYVKAALKMEELRRKGLIPVLSYREWSREAIIKTYFYAREKGLRKASTYIRAVYMEAGNIYWGIKNKDSYAVREVLDAVKTYPDPARAIKVLREDGILQYIEGEIRKDPQLRKYLAREKCEKKI